MKRRVKLDGMYRSKGEGYDPSTGRIVNSEGDIPLPDLLGSIGIVSGIPMVVVNGRVVRASAEIIVKANDVVKIFMPAGGG